MSSHNKHNIKDFLENKLGKYKSSFKNTSLDTENDTYLCQSNVEVYNFDKYIKDNFKHSCLPSSPDAIYVGDKKVYFVEFKNQKPSNISSSNIKSKFIHGAKKLQELLKDFTPTNIEFIFCVVFKEQISKYAYARSIKKNEPHYNLEQENQELNYFYKYIITQDVKFYKKEFANELKCKNI